MDIRYAEYSPEDLRDVERRINREKFPERYAALLQEIERREAGAPQVLEARAPEPIWHAKVREVWGAVFATTIALSMLCALIFAAAMPVARALIVNHSSPKPTATQTVPIQTGQGRDRRAVYVTPGEKARLAWIGRAATAGISTLVPVVVVIGLVAHGLGIRIFDAPRPRASST